MRLIGKVSNLRGPMMRAANARDGDDRVTTDHGAGNVVRALRAAKGKGFVGRHSSRSVKRLSEAAWPTLGTGSLRKPLEAPT